MLIISCEHATNAIPASYQSLFSSHTVLLASHRGYDIGALELAKRLAPLADYYLFANTSRLLVELNRSPRHPQVFSEITKLLSKADKQQILATYYFPYRQQLEHKIQQAITGGQTILHISVHSFTPELNGQQRNADIGLLYDSRRTSEKQFCQQWKRTLLEIAPQLKVRFNYPYQGKADGLTTYLRKQLSADQYLGIELEVNQKYPQTHSKAWQTLIQQLQQSLRNIVGS